MFSIPFNNVFNIYNLILNIFHQVLLLAILTYSYISLKESMIKEYPLRYKDIYKSIQTFFLCEFTSYFVMLAIDIVIVADQYFDFMSSEEAGLLGTFFIYVMWGIYPVFQAFCMIHLKESSDPL